jgi:hypothetical protein
LSTLKVVQTLSELNLTAAACLTFPPPLVLAATWQIWGALFMGEAIAAGK